MDNYITISIDPTQRQILQVQLDAIDAATGMGRTLREQIILMAGANVSPWLKAQDDKAAAIRAQIAAL